MVEYENEVSGVCVAELVRLQAVVGTARVWRR